MSNYSKFIEQAKRLLEVVKKGNKKEPRFAFNMVNKFAQKMKDRQVPYSVQAEALKMFQPYYKF